VRTTARPIATVGRKPSHSPLTLSEPEGRVEGRSLTATQARVTRPAFGRSALR